MNSNSLPRLPMRVPDEMPVLNSSPMAPQGADQCVMMIQTVATELQKLDYNAPGVKETADATNAIIACLNFLRSDTEKAALATFNGFRASLAAELQALESAGLPQNERDQRMSEAFERTIALSRDRVTAKLQGQADTLARAAVSALERAQATVADAWSRATGPLSLSTRLSIEDAVASSSLRDELKPQRPERWLALWQGFVTRGATREELISGLVIGALASAVLSSPPAKLSTMYGGLSAQEQGVVRGNAQRCLQALEARQLSKVPPHLAILQRAMAWNAQVFSFLCGSAVVHLNARELEARFSRGSVPPLEVHPLWVRRYVETMLRGQAAK